MHIFLLIILLIKFDLHLLFNFALDSHLREFVCLCHPLGDILLPFLSELSRLNLDLKVWPEVATV